MKVKTLIIILVSLLLTAVIVLGVVFAIKTKKNYEQQLANKDMEIMNLQTELDSIGQMVTVYQTAYDVRSGTEIKEEDLIPIEVPAKVADQFIQNIEDIVGHFYLVDIKANTPLVSSMVLPFRLDDDMRLLDIVLSEVPIGIEIDDYVDIRIAFEDGEDFLCMTNKRVIGVYGKVMKLLVNEKDIHVYESMKVDAACRRKVNENSFRSGNFINRIYAIEYVEGGAQKEGTKYYPIRNASTQILLRDPNIAGDLSLLYNEDTVKMREILDKKYEVTPEDIAAYKQKLAQEYQVAEQEYERILEQKRLEAQMMEMQGY